MVWCCITLGLEQFATAHLAVGMGGGGGGGDVVVWFVFVFFIVAARIGAAEKVALVLRGIGLDQFTAPAMRSAANK